MSSIAPARATETVSVIRPNFKVVKPRALRLAPPDVPWITTVRLPWGLEVCLLNISNTGVLIETFSKFTPGTVAELRLHGPDRALAVPARFVRSEVVAVDTRGVRYHAAAVFEKELDVVGQTENRPDVFSMSEGLADWLNQLSSALRGGADARTLGERIEQGLRRLAGVQDVRIRETPAGRQDGCESVCFPLGKASGSSAVLQATFGPGQAPSQMDFRLLQAGAALAVVVLTMSRDSQGAGRAAVTACSA